MGKPKPPAKNAPPPAGKPAAARGAAAYRRTMGEDHDTPDPRVPQNRKILPDDALLKTGRKPSEKTKKTKGTAEPASSKFKRAAQFMVLIGSDEASKILSRLDPTQVEAISKEIVGIKNIGGEEAEAVLEEFRSLLSPSYGYSGSSHGGVEEARKLLYAAFGPEKGEAMLVNAVPQVKENPFDFLADFTGEQLAMLFRDETPAACAMVFSRLPAKLTATALANTSPERKLDIVKRIARLKENSPEVIERAAAALKEKARHFGRSDTKTSEIDGKDVLAAILKHSDLSFGGRLLEELEENDPSLSREMKDRLYTLEDVASAADRPIQEKLRTMNDREIALLLRGRSDAFTQKILWNLSSARSARVKEESEIMGAVPKKEAEAAGKEFLEWFRINREEGRILMLKDEDVLI
ncbi:MAG: flagellar motor switch protein FliG [Treponema sp.]|nr:flagellar motor switch protein FliG [Treponema sp.]